MANSYVKQITVASFFNSKYDLKIDRTTINKIWQKREQWLSILPNLQILKIFKQRLFQFSLLNKAIQIWILQAIAVGLPLSNIILQQKSLEFAQKLHIENEVKCGSRWVYR